MVVSRVIISTLRHLQFNDNANLHCFRNYVIIWITDALNSHAPANSISSIRGFIIASLFNATEKLSISNIKSSFKPRNRSRPTWLAVMRLRCGDDDQIAGDVGHTSPDGCWPITCDFDALHAANREGELKRCAWSILRIMYLIIHVNSELLLRHALIARTVVRVEQTERTWPSAVSEVRKCRSYRVGSTVPGLCLLDIRVLKFYVSLRMGVGSSVLSYWFAT